MAPMSVKRQVLVALLAVGFLVALPLTLLFLRGLRVGDSIVLDQAIAKATPGLTPDAVTGPSLEITVQALHPRLPLPTESLPPRLQVRLSSTRRSRILLVERHAPQPSLRLAWPQDGEYFDLGALREDAVASFTLRALLPVRGWGLVPAAAPGSGRFRVSAGTGAVPIDYRVVVSRPVAVSETIDRATFFLRHSLIATLCMLLGLLAVFLGALAVLRQRPQRAAAGGVAAVILLYVALTPPFQAADETSHAATLEYSLAQRIRPAKPYWPASITSAARAIDQDRVQYNPEVPLAVLDGNQRRHAAHGLRLPLTDEAFACTAPTRNASTQTIDERSPAFYGLSRMLPRGALDLPILERLYLYRLLAAGFGLAATLLGIAALGREHHPPGVFAAVVLLVAVPQWAAIASSTSNYAPGMGLAMLAACFAVNAVPAPSTRRPIWLTAAMLAALLGTYYLRDDLMLCIFYAGLGGFAALSAILARRGHGAVAALATAGAIAILGVLLHDRLPLSVVVGTSWLNEAVARGLVTRWVPFCLLPLLLAFAAVTSDRFARGTSLRRTLRTGFLVALGLGVLAAIAVTIALPDRRLPTSAFVEGWSTGAYLRRAVLTGLTTFFTWDQDTMLWRSLFGALGWHDLFLPSWIYATARWTTSLALLSLPSLYASFARQDRSQAGWSLVLAAGGLTTLLTALLLRSAFGIVHGRFLLFSLPLIVLPFARLISGTTARSVLVTLSFATVGLALFTVLYFIPVRYFFSGGGAVGSLVP